MLRCAFYVWASRSRTNSEVGRTPEIRSSAIVIGAAAGSIETADGAYGTMTVLAQVTRSIVRSDGGWPRLCPPPTLRLVIWPEASNAQNSMAAVSALGSTVCVLIQRLNSSCSYSTALVVAPTSFGSMAPFLVCARQRAEPARLAGPGHWHAVRSVVALDRLSPP